jgi:hypothetical protein
MSTKGSADEDVTRMAEFWSSSLDPIKYSPSCCPASSRVIEFSDVGQAGGGGIAAAFKDK